jgi:MoaA/NifB/PqqE/SkfB family radical SAM enzyme
MSFKYDLEADWMLLSTCNYRCTYCFFDEESLGAKLRTFASAQQWSACFDATGYTWLLHITGGEPSIYPKFVELCDELTQRHYISLNTNLTHRALSDFAERIDPSRVSFINAAFHLEERDHRSGHTVFLRHAELLRSKGFRILVSIVATPTALTRFEEAVELLKSTGLAPIPKLFRGSLDGRMYPRSYTELDKNRFRLFCDNARELYQPLFESNDETPTIDMFRDDEHLDGVPSFAGMSCDAGRRFVRIESNGDVYRCGPGEWFGNVLDRTFVPRPGPTPCNTEYCYYFCKKYSTKEKTLGVEHQGR